LPALTTLAALVTAYYPAAAAAQASKTHSASAAKSQKPEKQAEPSKTGLSIIVLVNDEPITAYEIEQRARFLALNAKIGDRVKDKFKHLVQSESTQQYLRGLLDDVLKKNPGAPRERIQAIFDERKKQYAMGLEKQAVESARAAMVPQFKKEAKEELIDERLKLQEAKKVGAEVGDEEIGRIMKGIAERNKMSEEQFGQHLKSMGVDISTMRERIRTQFAWRDVVRRRFAAMISVTQREVDRMITAAVSESGADTVELQVQRITLPLSGGGDQSALARRYAEGEALRRKFSGCKTMSELAKSAGGSAKYEDMKYIKPSSIAEPTRSMLLAAKDGDVLPPTTAANGIEIYAVCGRRPIKADEKQRELAQDELKSKEIEILAKRHLRDLRQDAHIEYR
jgi:peptidyl-prolyl cis-trans isomerase SurA